MCPAIPPLQGTPEPELTKILTCPTGSWTAERAALLLLGFGHSIRYRHKILNLIRSMNAENYCMLDYNALLKGQSSICMRAQRRRTISTPKSHRNKNSHVDTLT
jgi:hypothetical protein